VGGLVGYAEASVATSYAIKNVTGTTAVGGLIGQDTGGSVSDSYAQGSVTGGDKVGGLIGRKDPDTFNIFRTYASGTITLNGAGSAGGFIGDNQRMGSFQNYWNATTGGATEFGVGFTSGATGLTSTQMKQQAQFVGFNFSGTWQIVEGVTEPYLDWAAVAVTTTTTALASSANPSLPGQSVTFTATITGNAPSGTVAFQDGGNPINACIAVAVTAGQAPCTITGLALGTHAITAVYSGDLLNTGSTSPVVNQHVIPPSLDVDASSPDSKYDALTDGLLLLRYMQGITGDALVAGALGQTAARTDPAQIKLYLDFLGAKLDIDGDGNVDPATDGVLIVRYLLGLRGDPLIANAVALPGAMRQTAMAIEQWLQDLLP